MYRRSDTSSRTYRSGSAAGSIGICGLGPASRTRAPTGVPSASATKGAFSVMYRRTRSAPFSVPEYGVVPHCSVLPRAFIQTTAPSSMSRMAGASAGPPGRIRIDREMSLWVLFTAEA